MKFESCESIVARSRPQGFASVQRGARLDRPSWIGAHCALHPPFAPHPTRAMPLADPSAAARACFDMHRSRTRYRPLDAAVRSGPLEDAYRVQDALHVLLRESGRGEIVGWKIALTSQAMQHMTGIDRPVCGAIFSSTVHASPAQRSLAAHHHLGVEFEVAVRLGADLDAAAGPWDNASVADRVEACMPAFELVEDGDADYTTLDAFTLVAQNTWNGGVVLGEPVVAWRELDLAQARTRCWIDGALAGEGRAGDAMGHPLQAVGWLANQLNARGGALRAGMIVMTGSSITTKFPSAGQHLRFAIDGLGEIAMRVTP
jgi:2-keto-4-pentenoate hydratase